MDENLEARGPILYKVGVVIIGNASVVGDAIRPRPEQLKPLKGQ